MKIYIDADACPVINITIRTAKEYRIPVILICDNSHIMNKYDAQVITVEKGADSADLKLANHVGSGDIVITQDYGLAAICLAKGAAPINQNGLIFNNDNIDTLLYQRFVNKKSMLSGKHIKGPKKRRAEDDKRFLNALEKVIKNNGGKTA